MPKYLCNSDNNLCKFLGDRPLECIGSCLNKKNCKDKKTLDQYDKERLFNIIIKNMGLIEERGYYYLKDGSCNQISLGRIPDSKLLNSILLTIYEIGFNKGTEYGANMIKSEFRELLGISNKSDD